MLGMEVDCKACHTLSYTAVNCLDCHADERLMEAEHAGLGLLRIGNCVTCHPSGTPGDDNFPLKAQPPQDAEPAVDSSQGTSQAGEQRTAQPTFSSMDSGRAPEKEQDGNATRP